MRKPFERRSLFRMFMCGVGGGGGTAYSVVIDPEAVATVSDGTTLSITITGTPYAGGPYLVTLADLNTGPVCIFAPVISGLAEEGSTLTCQSGLWVYDTIYGVPVVTRAWRSDGTPIGGETATTFVTGSGQVGTAVDCNETLTQSVGARSLDSNNITVTAAAAPYTEYGVNFGGTAYLDKTGDFAADPANLLIFISTECPSTLARRRLFSQATDEGWGEYDTAANGFRVRLLGTSAATITFFATPDLTASAGQRLNILIALQPSGAKMGWTAYYRVGTGSWTLGASGVSVGDISNIDLSRGSFRFGANVATGAQIWDTILYRHAVWSDITIPDLTNAGVRANFADATTAVTVDPATSVAAYGTPRFDVYGPAADYNALINHGAVGNFTSKTGTFT